MVLSTIPVESNPSGVKRFNNHNTHQQIVRIASPITSAANSVSTTSVKLATVASTMPASKFLVLQSTDGNASTTIATSSNATATTYLNGQDGSKVVLVTNEQMIGAIDQNGTTTVTTTNSTNDEELTSLTWLHDKNLLKGINLSCAPNVKHITNNNNNVNTNNNNSHTKVISGDVAAAAASATAAACPSVSGTHSPNSDYMDESYVSADENPSPQSATNSSQAEPQPLIIYNSNTEASPLTSTSPSVMASVAMTTMAATSANYQNNNNNSLNSKNRNALNVNQPPAATSIIHLSPGGSTVSTTSIESMVCHDVTHVSSGTSSRASTPHQHYHKKYIKQMNALNGSPITVTTVSGASAAAALATTSNTITVNTPSSSSSSLSSPSASSLSSTTTYTIPLNQDYSNTIKFADQETVIVENDYAHHIGAQPHHSNNAAATTTAVEIERIVDYATPMNSPHHQQIITTTPLTPQKPFSATAMNAMMSPGGGNGSVHSSPTTVLPPVSPSSSSSPSQNKQKNQISFPYDPFIHTTNKPPLSFSSLIFLAIEDAQEKALPVKEIYAWIVQHYPYFKTAPTGWKNSVRHNLSLNKCFQKVEKAPNMGKGSLWRVEQQYKQNLVIALTRSSYHPNTTAMEKATASLKNPPRTSDSPPSMKATTATAATAAAASAPTRPLDAELFPRLSKFMANMTSGTSNGSGPDDDYAIHNGNNVECHIVNGGSNGDRIAMHIDDHDHESHAINVERIARDWGVDNIDDVNAATAMLALKHGPKVFAETFHTGTPIITSVPSEDHTYSAGKRSSNSNETSSNQSNNNNNNVNITNNNNNLTNSNSNNSAGAIATDPKSISNINENSVNINTTTTTNLVHNNSSTTSSSSSNSNNNNNNLTLNRSHFNHSDNTSNGTSSDAAYESSEESQNIISAEELEARRHQEGVDAFLSFATEVSSMSSPIKRPPSADYLENIPAHHFNNINHNNNNNNNHIITNNNNNNSSSNINGGTPSYFYYDGDSSPTTISLSHHHHHNHHSQQAYTYLSAPSPPKKSRTRTLRTKFKKKTWLR